MLDRLLSELKDKTEVFHNIISPTSIREMSKHGEGYDDNFDGIRLLTVGRLSSEKGQDLMIKVVKQLKDDGYNVRWYAIGEGTLRVTCEKLIKKYNLEGGLYFIGF